MANKRLSGIVELKGDGDKVYTLKFGTNAICKIEEKYQKSLQGVLDSMQDANALQMNTIRNVIQATMKGDPTPEMVGDIIDEVGIDAILAALQEMFTGKAPEPVVDPQAASELTGASVS